MSSSMREEEEDQNLVFSSSGDEISPLLSTDPNSEYTFATKLDEQRRHRAVLQTLAPERTTSPLFYRNIQIPCDSSINRRFFNLKKLFKFTGPGLLISVAYFDPGNLDIDLQSGAIAGYKLLWVLLYSSIAGFLIQYLSVKLGSVTGYHLAEICQREYSKVTRVLLWIMLEISIIASDIQQVIGSALALNILSNGLIPMWTAILITGGDVFLFLFLETTGIRVVEAVFAFLIAIMAIAFVYMFIRVEPDQEKILEGLAIPWCKNCTYLEINQLIAIVGSIVMPHNIYFHSSLVLSRNFERTEYAIREANRYYAIESGMALFIAFLFNLFVTSISAKSFFNTVQSSNVTIFTAGDFINVEYGFTTKIIWAIGLLSAGQCSTISGTYAGQFIMEGLTRINLKRWMRSIMTRTISILPCLAVAFLSYDSLIHLSLWCNIVSAIQLPFALLPIVHFTSSKRIMGAFKNHILTRFFAYIITMCIIALNIYFIVNFILLGVNNIYRIKSFGLANFAFKLIFRRLFCPYNAFEIDELLRTNPIYRRPERGPFTVAENQVTTSQTINGHSSNGLLAAASPLGSVTVSTSQSRTKCMGLFRSNKNNLDSKSSSLTADRSLMESQAISSNEYTLSNPII